MNPQLYDFLLHWGIMSLSLWVASHLFSGLEFSSKSSLLVSALMLGFVNAILKPILILLTLPLTLLTLGLFLLVINALMIQLVAALVSGFKVSDFWTAFFASIFIAIFGLFLEWLLPGNGLLAIPAGNLVSA
ncbi:MAG TPA: phage holin family protein [Methylophilaceae bacterium]|nr:phage holin family protein [Methylophilaceae bacterium]HQR59988.1 phage holin family protein [Methylophilaceae bacterium]